MTLTLTLTAPNPPALSYDGVELPVRMYVVNGTSLRDTATFDCDVLHAFNTLTFGMKCNVKRLNVVDEASSCS